MRSPKQAVTTIGQRIALTKSLVDWRVFEDFVENTGFVAFFCNVHMLMLSREDLALKTAMERADFVFADGSPVAWLQSRLAGVPAATIRGYQAMLHLCMDAEARGCAIGLYGSTPEVLAQLKARLMQWYPALDIAYCYAPPQIDGQFEESPERLAEINSTGISHLFVALGCPKQEKWVDRHRGDLKCNLLAVGAAFDWLAGVEPMAPKWVEQHGLTWLQRWVRHPIRHFKRYGYYNTKFVMLALVELMKKRRT